MTPITYIGKCLLLENAKKERVLVVGDIHLGYENEQGSAAGAVVSQALEKQMYADLAEIFEKVGRVEKVVLLGDLKHGFTRMSEQERHALVNLFDYLRKTV